MSEIVVVRDIDIVTAEIKTIEGQVAKTAIYGCLEIGKRLVEAKEMVGHGGWGKYLEEKVRYSQQWATNLMNLYREYGSTQESLFESFADSHSFAKIDVTKHILLLGVPAEEREAFAAEHDAENATTRELQAAIRERDEAKSKVGDLKKKLDDTADQLNIAGDKLADKDAKIEQLRQQAAASDKRLVDANGKVAKLQESLEKAQKSEKAAKEALKAAREHPQIPEAMMEEMRQQMAADAAKEAAEAIQKELDAAKLVAAQAEEKRLAAERALQEAEKKAKLTDGNVALVKAYMEGVQDQFNKLVGAIKLVEQADPERGAILRKNAREKVLPAMLKALEG